MRACILCEEPWVSGDRSIVIGNMGTDGPELVHVHIDCLAENTLGPEWRTRLTEAG